MSQEKLGKFLREVSNWRWDEFVRAENDISYTSNQAMIFALVRSCAMQKMDAIRMSLNRLDGKLKTPVKIEYPKIYYLFPNATLDLPDLPDSSSIVVQSTPVGPNTVAEALAGELIPAPELEPDPELTEDDLPSLSLRQTLTKLADLPREYPEAIVEYAQQTEAWVKHGGPLPDENPLVKSVVAAHLLILAAKRDIGALSEVFDQIDGKLAETIQLIGEDIYITSYSTIAPPEAYVNEQGVLEVEAKVAQNLWAQKLGATSA